MCAFKNAALLRRQLEVVIDPHMTGAFTPLPSHPQPRVPSGIAPIDELLDGGLPVGVITELVGTECSGRTSMALACIAAMTQTGSVCAWIDVSDTLEPESTAASGIDLKRLLWVRCGTEVRQPSDKLEETTHHADKQKEHAQPGENKNCWRSDSIPEHMPQAIGSLLQSHGGLYDNQVRREKKLVGTPAYPNRKLSFRSEERVEQLNSDRQPPRRGDNLSISPRCAEPQLRQPAHHRSQARLIQSNDQIIARVASDKHWQSLDQGLRAVDLLLQSGGFAAIVLDLASIPPKFVWRVPMATWFRFRSACERTRVSLILLTQHACAGSSAEIVVRLHPGTLQAENRSMNGILYRGDAARRRNHAGEDRVISICKPPKSERGREWKSELPWN